MRGIRYFKSLAGGVGFTLLLLLAFAPAGASSANISHSYSTSGSIPTGSLVSLDSAKTNYVVKANVDNGKSLLGIAVADNDSLIAVDAKEGKIQVATSGEANALVSTINGPIKAGDQIAVSPFNGVGMKTTTGGHIIGLAQAAFNTDSAGATLEDAVNKDGKTSKIAIGYIRINIAIGAGTTQGGGPNLNGLQKITKSITGHVVSTARVVISVVIAVVALAAIIALVYASIYGGIISIGRNPLAKFAVFRTMTTVMGMVALVALIAGTTIFLLLR